MLVAPHRDELTVLHVGLGNLASEFNAVRLDHESVPYIVGILSFICFLVGENAEFHKFRICNVIESEKVRPGFFQC